ncbi:MAG: response regulator [Betaproteobacteria bacterium]|nr:response regulator [Betaproteobacteria bacterium]
MGGVARFLVYSIKGRLIVSVMLLHALLMGMIVFDMVVRQRGFMRQQIAGEGEALAAALAANAPSWVIANDVAALDELVDGLQGVDNLSLAIIMDSHGRVRAASDRALFNLVLDDEASRRLLQLVGGDREKGAKNKAAQQFWHDGLIDTMAPIVAGGRNVGYARVMLDSAPVEAELDAVVRKGLFYILAALCIGGVIAWLLVRRMTRQLERISAGAEAIAGGDLDVSISGAAGRDEVAHLTRDINRMARALREDRSEREQIRAEIFVEKEKAQVTLNSIGDAVITTDVGGAVEFLNPVAEEHTGWRLDDARGQPLRRVFNIVNETTREVVVNPVEQAIAGNCIVGLANHTVLIGRTGHEIGIEDSAAPIRDRNGKIIGAVLVFHDVSEKRRAEEAAKAALAAAEAASYAKSAFLANMSHEIRTPMNGVIGMTELLLDTELTDEQREFAEIVGASANSLLGLINDILDFSKIEAGKLDIESIDFDLRALLDDVSAMLALRADEKGLEFVNLVEPDVPDRICGDPGRLRQVLLNLAGNGIKFTGDGEVVVHVRPLTLRDKSVRLRFDVRDTGIGIPGDRVGALFDPFTQADISTTRRFGGTGLGLAICKRLVDLMGGEIGVDSVPGQGSTFWFSLPFGRHAGGVEALRPPADGAAPLAGSRVLVVDDNATNRRLIELLLEGWQCAALCAAGAREALAILAGEHAAGRPVDAAIIDMNMPGTDGEELGRCIKSDPDWKDMPLAMLTSVAFRGDGKRLTDIGFDAYLTKPVRSDHLQAALAAALGQSRTGENAARRLITRHTLNEGVRRTRILLVEDNPANQKVALGFLSRFGYAADLATNGREALEALARTTYDLVLMDCQMPVMDGYEAARAIRAGAGGVLDPAVPVVAMTANAMEGDREKALAAGMDDYLTKPVDSQRLNEVIVEVLRGAQTAIAGKPAPA